jgi:hypothetical protein
MAGNPMSMLGSLVLYGVGFGHAGIKAGSVAATAMAHVGNVAAGWPIACAQSTAATNNTATLGAVVVVVLAMANRLLR